MEVVAVVSYVYRGMANSNGLPGSETMNTRLNADESAELLTRKIRAQEHFSFWRFGDGALECIRGIQGQTCDHERYTPSLAANLMECISGLADWGHVSYRPAYFGDWLSASFSGPKDASRYEAFHQLLFAGRVDREQWLHFESLLFMRESLALVDFYLTVQADPRRKLYMGPFGNIGAAQWLNAQFLETPMSGLYAATKDLEYSLMNADFEVLIYGAGMAGVIPVYETWTCYPDRTYISLGSALDPLFRGKSRKQQLSREQCWRMFGEVDR